MNKYLYIDGHSLLFRAFYAYNVENFSGEDDFPTNAIYGFISMLKNVCREFNPTHLAVTFDTKEKTFRNKLLPIYKGNRESPPEGFLPQLDYLQTLLQIAGIKVLTYPGYEADDILATLSTNTAKLDDSEVFIFSGDRDTFQLIKPNVSILYPGRSMRDLKKFNDDEVFEKYGLHALQYPDLAALVGETSDNIPGIPGVGPKTATKWLTQYGNLQNVIDHADEVGGKIGETLRANTDVALLNRKINNLVCDLELDADFDSFDIDLSAKRADFDEMKVAFKKLHFSKNSQKLLLDILHLNSLDSNDNFTLDAKADSDKNAMADSRADSKDDSDNLTLAKNIFNTTTTTTSSIKEVPKVSNVSTQPALFDADDLFGVSNNSSNSVPDTIADVAVAENSVTDENIKLQVARYITDPDLYIKYSKDDSFEDDDLETLMKAINENGQAELFELEYELTSVIEKMNNTGVKINPSILSDALQDIAKKHSESELSAKNLIFDNFDNTEDFNLSSPKQLQTILFDVLELPKTKKNKTGYTTDAKAISKLIEKTDDNIVAGFLKNLQDFREYSKLKTTIEGLIKAADENDIIHTTFLQFNTGTGRLSSKNPNLQNLPFKKEIGKKIRAAFIPSDGYKNLISADYSQIEMRIMAHLAGDSKTIEAFKNGQDLHKYIASSVYSIDYYDVTTAQRNSIKSLVYGLAYGLTTFGLAADLNVGYQEAKHITEEFFAEFSTIKEYLDNSIKIANENGYTSTILNRRRYLSNFSAMSKFDKTATDRIALNAPIQGSAADIIKISMLKISKLLNDSDLKSRMILQIHDELVFEVADGEEDQLKSFILKAMEDTVKLSVPIPVSIGVGANLLDAAH